jgi:preprotein translocase subunit YajC
MVELMQVPLLVAMAQPGQGSGNVLVQIFPFALMLGIFYLLVLMPMRKRQKKVQEFQAALKVGDRVITTGGIYGQVTRVGEGTVQLQVADKVRIEVARASVGGYQGQAPVVQAESGSSL